MSSTDKCILTMLVIVVVLLAGTIIVGITTPLPTLPPTYERCK